MLADMASIHIDPRQTKVDLCQFVAQGILRRSRLDEASDNLKQEIQETIEHKAQGVFLWAHLILDILRWQTTEDDIRQCLHTAPSGIEDMITELLKVYAIDLKEEEAEEFNTILVWLSCATCPLRYIELEAALQRQSPSRSKALPLVDHLLGTYALLLEIRHEDGVCMIARSSDDQPGSEDSSTISESTVVVFAHASIDEYFQKELSKFSRRRTVIPIGVERAEAELKMLRTCLAVLIETRQAGCLDTLQALRTYAKESWAHHLSSCVIGKVDCTRRSDKLAKLQKDITSLLYRVLNEEEVLEVWCRDTTWQFFHGDLAPTTAKFVLASTERYPDLVPVLPASWLQCCKERPYEPLRPIAEIYVKEGLQGN